MARRQASEVAIGKFDILATYSLARALRDGSSLDEAKERGMVAAVMGAKARSGAAKAEKDGDAAETKESTITARSFDRQVGGKLGEFFDDVFLPAMKRLVEAGLSYEDVKRAVKIPRTWGAKISGEQFEERVRSAFAGKASRPPRKRPAR